MIPPTDRRALGGHGGGVFYLHGQDDFRKREAAAVLGAMEALGARREPIFAAVGPAISAAAYEVGPELRAAFIEDDEESRRFFTPAKRAGYAMFDLPGCVVAKLRNGGVGSPEQIDRCTYTREDEFFSHRRSTHRGESQCGNQISAITLGPRAFIEAA